MAELGFERRSARSGQAFLPLPFYFYFKSFQCLFLREREREREGETEGEGQREREIKSEAGSRLRAVGTEPHAGLERTNDEIMT